MKKVMVLIAVAAVVCSWGVAAGKTDVSGKWEITTTSPRGDRTNPIEFVQTGEELKVKAQGREGTVLEGKGKVVGDKIEWTITRTTPRGEMTMSYQGTVSGDKMEGDVRFGEMGSGSWKAIRKP